MQNWPYSRRCREAKCHTCTHRRCGVASPLALSGAVGEVEARELCLMEFIMELPTIFSVTENEIDLNDLLAKITLTSTGAAAIFTGMVRGQTLRGDEHETEYLEYEAYVPMAEAKMKQVADEIRSKWPVVEGIAIVQRIGKLYPKTPTVLIACTAAHRDTGVFDAARYGIDRLKEIVPIWKKEVSPDGEFWVEGDYIPKAGE
jgi:molybdopterin synthase catalytic subunit